MCVCIIFLYTFSELILVNFVVCLQAAILQHTADYIYQLEQEKTRLLSQNCQLKRLVSKQEGELLSTASVHKKRKLEDPAGTCIVVVVIVECVSGSYFFFLLCRFTVTLVRLFEGVGRGDEESSSINVVVPSPIAHATTTRQPLINGGFMCLADTHSVVYTHTHTYTGAGYCSGWVGSGDGVGTASGILVLVTHLPPVCVYVCNVIVWLGFCQKGDVCMFVSGGKDTKK